MDRGGKLEATDMKAAVAAYDEAIEDFKRYHAMLPSLKEASNDLGIAYTKLGVTAGDIDLIRGIALAEGKAYDKARAAFEHALSSQAARRAASYNLARTLELAGKADEARRAYQQYARLYPGGPWARAAEAAAARR